MAGIDLSHLFSAPILGPTVVAEAKVQVIVDPASGKVRLHVEDHLGPMKGPDFDAEIDPVHALVVAAQGVGSLIGHAFEKKKPG